MVDLLADNPPCTFGCLGGKKSDEVENKYGPGRQPAGDIVAAVRIDSEPSFGAL